MILFSSSQNQFQTILLSFSLADRILLFSLLLLLFLRLFDEEILSEPDQPLDPAYSCLINSLCLYRQAKVSLQRLWEIVPWFSWEIKIFSTRFRVSKQNVRFYWLYRLFSFRFQCSNFQLAYCSLLSMSRNQSLFQISYCNYAEFSRCSQELPSSSYSSTFIVFSLGVGFRRIFLRSLGQSMLKNQWEYISSFSYCFCLWNPYRFTCRTNEEKLRCLKYFGKISYVNRRIFLIENVFVQVLCSTIPWLNSSQIFHRRITLRRSTSFSMNPDNFTDFYFFLAIFLFRQLYGGIKLDFKGTSFDNQTSFLLLQQYSSQILYPIKCYFVYHRQTAIQMHI